MTSGPTIETPVVLPPEAQDSTALSASDVDRSVEDRPRSSDSGIVRGLGALDLFVLGAILLWPCAYLPFFANQAWTPRVMALIVAVPTGIWALTKLIRRGERAASVAALLLGWTLVSAILSDNALLSFKGVVSTNSSVVIYAGSIGLWALAHFISPRARSWVVPTLLVACGLNLGVGVLQVVFRIESTSIGLVGDRAVGLIGNSMIFGAVMAAGGAVCIRRGAHGSTPIPRSWWFLGVFAFSLGTAISGSRVATVAVLAAGLISVVSAPRLRALACIAGSLGGVAAGTLLHRVSGGSRDSLSRLTEGGGTAGRTTVWRVSVDAVSERPITGWGLGRFQRALQGRFSLEELASAPHLPRFGDAHNVVVELLVVLGIPGLVLGIGFAWYAARRCEPALVAASGAMAITWLLQPMSYHTLALAFVLLGAGTVFRPEGSEPPETPPPAGRRWVGLLVVGAGLIPALGLGAADIRLDQALERGDPGAVRSAAGLFGGDPTLMNVAGNLAAEQAGTNRDAAAATLEAFARAVSIEPERAVWLGELAAAQSAFTNDSAEARRTAERAIELDPYNERAWTVVWVSSMDLGDDERSDEAARILCRFGLPPACAQTNPDVGTDASN